MKLAMLLEEIAGKHRCATSKPRSERQLALAQAGGYSGEGEHRFRRQAERRSGVKVNSSRSEATLA